MGLTTGQRERIGILLTEKIEAKLKKYGRESTSMPFLARLIQDNEKIAAYSFIHSVATTLGMSIYEDVSVILASDSSKECFRNYDIGGVISPNQNEVIGSIVDELRQRTRLANIKNETTEVLQASTHKAKVKKSGRIADFYMLRDGVEHYFEIKTVKPNIDVFEKSKTKLLEWIARRRRPVKVFLAFPYNPYHPDPYSRFTEMGMMDHPNDFLIGDEYWNFLGGSNTFAELLEVFDDVGKTYKLKIDEKIRMVVEKRISSY